MNLPVNPPVMPMLAKRVGSIPPAGGAQSRWSNGKDLSWEPLRPERVVEVTYEHMQSGRFRHMAHFHRWRPDRAPASCTFAQLEVVPPEELAVIFNQPRSSRALIA